MDLVFFERAHCPLNLDTGLKSLQIIIQVQLQRLGAKIAFVVRSVKVYEVLRR